MSNVFYRAVLESASDGYCVFFPDFDGCTSWGETIDQAASNSADALALFLDYWEGPLPDPSPLNGPIDPEADPAAIVLISLELVRERQLVAA